jgi:hypothetical protein
VYDVDTQFHNVDVKVYIFPRAVSAPLFLFFGSRGIPGYHTA